VALKLGQPLYQVDYSSVISKYMGDTAKHIKLAFGRAAHHGAVLLLDQGDSPLSGRVSLDESCDTSISRNRNTLMQELDHFVGVVVMTMKLFGNYDVALQRRVPRHIQFRLPNLSMRREIFALHRPNPDRVGRFCAIPCSRAGGAGAGTSSTSVSTPSPAVDAIPTRISGW